VVADRSTSSSLRKRSVDRSNRVEMCRRIGLVQVVSHAPLEELGREPIELTDRSRKAGAADRPVEGEASSLAGRLERVAIPERGRPAAALQRDVPIGLVLGELDVVVDLTAWQRTSDVVVRAEAAWTIRRLRLMSTAV
jgi:hypothetical protein